VEQQHQHPHEHQHGHDPKDAQGNAKAKPAEPKKPDPTTDPSFDAFGAAALTGLLGAEGALSQGPDALAQRAWTVATSMVNARPEKQSDAG